MSATAVTPYLELIRFNRPIGTLLLLWPTCWALWIAGAGKPDGHLIGIFMLGTFLMRSAGCVINDYADRHIDGEVKRTRMRPLVTGTISERNALLFAGGLILAAFGLVMLTNRETVILSMGALLLAAVYPFCKRFTNLPQLVLGAAFSWGIPMAFTAQTGDLPTIAWAIFAINLLWTVMYDTIYAMVDRDDDIRIGVKSTAILLGSYDRIAVGILQAAVIGGLLLVGSAIGMLLWFYVGIGVTAGLFLYQQWLIRDRDRDACFHAFLNNNWVGAAVFAGIVAQYILR